MLFKAGKSLAAWTHDRAAGAENGDASVIGIDLTVSGDLRGVGDVQIDGRVEGAISSRSVTITESGHMEGQIYAETVHVGGSVHGPIEAVDVTVAKTARIVGTVAHNQLTVESGATIEGLRPWRPPGYRRLG